MKRRAIVVVCDGLGVGTAPDAALFGDEGKKTLQHVLRDGKPHLPNLTRLGLLHTMYADAPAGLPAPTGAFGRLAEASAGKDTTTGHWELMGLTLDVAFPLYPDGFPPEVVEPFERAIERKVLWNKPASGTTILEQLGDEHVRTGPAHPLHLRRLRLPDRRARGRRPDRDVVRVVPGGARDPEAPAPGRPRHRPALRGGERKVPAHAPAKGLHRSAVAARRFSTARPCTA